MRLTTRQSGVISYAGLDKDALWAAAKRAFAQADEPVPERYASFMPLFPIELVVNMRYVGFRADAGSPVSPKGFSIDPAEYHQKLWEEQPELYQDDNYRRNFNYEGKFIGRGAMTVDRVWAMRFPQYQPFMGERLNIYMLGGGHQAVAVPESVYPRGGGMLRNIETELRVTARCEHYVSYLLRRLAAGDKYDSAAFETDYLRVNELLPVAITQAELGRVMQDLCIIRGLKGERPVSKLFTENAKRAEGITQYVPFRCACDTFAEEPITRSTARLIQLYFEEEDVSDLWLPYADACEYVDRRLMAIDVSALCHGFQLAPEHDPVTRGGRYPTHARVAVVRDRDLRPLVADTINNPAYGSGMSPLGMMNRLVYLPDSRELLRQGKLSLDEAGFVCENANVTAEEYRAMVLAATAQELKGRLIDAMYRRESALSQMQESASARERADELLQARVDSLAKSVAALGAGSRRGQLSGYDADIDYLTRMAQSREGVPRDGFDEPAPFVPDALREQSIESGYAMRNSARYASISSAALEDSEEAADSDGQAGAECGASDTASESGLPDDANQEIAAIAETDVTIESAEATSADESSEASADESAEATDDDSTETSADEPTEATADESVGDSAEAVSTTEPIQANGVSTPAVPASTPVRFEQLRMFGMESIAPKRVSGANAERPAMASVARGGVRSGGKASNPDGSMARMVNKKKKKK